MLELPFKLKHLVIDQTSLNGVSRQFIDYLRLHFASLHTLSILSNLNVDILGFVLRNMRTIQILEIDVSELPSVETAPWFWDGIEPLQNVQGLKIARTFPNRDIAVKFFALFPSLRSLDISDAFRFENFWFNKLPAIFPRFEQLESCGLHWHTVYPFWLNDIYVDGNPVIFPKLRKLTVIDLYEFHHKQWFDYFCIPFITDHCSTLKDITIEFRAETKCVESKINGEIYDAINECNNLKRLCFTSGPDHHYGDFESLLSKENPWKLKFSSKEGTYHFPDDKKIFKDDMERIQ